MTTACRCVAGRRLFWWLNDGRRSADAAADRSKSRMQRRGRLRKRMCILTTGKRRSRKCSVFPPLGSVRTRVVQHPRVVRRLLPGSCAGTARPRRFLPGRRAGTGRSICRNRSAARQEPTAVPAVPAREPPPGAARPGGRCGRNRPAPAGHDGVSKSRIVSFPYHIIKLSRFAVL